MFTSVDLTYFLLHKMHHAQVSVSKYLENILCSAYAFDYSVNLLIHESHVNIHLFYNVNTLEWNVKE
jgi:hypothetical protein